MRASKDVMQFEHITNTCVFTVPPHMQYHLGLGNPYNGDVRVFQSDKHSDGAKFSAPFVPSCSAQVRAGKNDNLHACDLMNCSVVSDQAHASCRL